MQQNEIAELSSLNAQAVESINNYINDKNRMIHEELEELVSELLSYDFDFNSKAYDMQHLCQELLVLLSNPDISKKVTSENPGAMLLRLVNFFRDFQNSKIVEAKMDLTYTEMTFATEGQLINISRKWKQSLEIENFERKVYDRK